MLREFQINPHYVIYYYLDQTFLFNVDDKFNRVDLNQVEDDIIISINELHDIKKVWQNISNMYCFSADDEEAMELFDSVVDDFLGKGLIEEGSRTVSTYGQKGKCYPFMATIEMTNKCNFKCTHCYKEANKDNSKFISAETVDKVMNVLRGKIYALEITGGEATIHPQFAEIVSKLEAPSISLLTNGAQLNMYSTSTLKKFSSMQVSLYGCCEEEYRKYAVSTQFQDVCKGIKKAVNEGISVSVAIILRKTNINRIDKYIDLLIELGINLVTFGTSSKLGRNNTDSETDWDLSDSEINDFANKLKDLRIKYPGIVFEDFGLEENDFDKTKINYRFKCNAGTRFIVISENEKIRPCIYAPAQYFETTSVNDYCSLIENGLNIEYGSCITSCLKDLISQDKHLDSICPVGFIGD